MTKFGDTLRDARTRQEKTLRELAEATDMSIQYISNIEIGNVPPPSAAKIEKLAEALGEDKEALLLLARRIDADLIAQAKKAAPKMAQISRLISFFDSALKLGEDNPIGGVEGVVELLLGETILRGQKQLKGAESVKFMSSILKQLSEQSNGSVPEEIEETRALGQAILAMIDKNEDEDSRTAQNFDVVREMITELRTKRRINEEDSDE